MRLLAMRRKNFTVSLNVFKISFLFFTKIVPSNKTLQRLADPTVQSKKESHVLQKYVFTVVCLGAVVVCRN